MYFFFLNRGPCCASESSPTWWHFGFPLDIIPYSSLPLTLAYSIWMPDRLNTYAFKILFWFVCKLFLLKGLSGEMCNFSYTVLTGRILNRFSKDIGHMDDLLPLTFLDFIQVCKIMSCFQTQNWRPWFFFSRAFPWGEEGGRGAVGPGGV